METKNHCNGHKSEGRSIHAIVVADDEQHHVRYVLNSINREPESGMTKVNVDGRKPWFRGLAPAAFCAERNDDAAAT